MDDVLWGAATVQEIRVFSSNISDTMILPLVLEGKAGAEYKGLEYFRVRTLDSEKWSLGRANTISVAVCHSSKSVDFGPVNIRMATKGRGVGSALMSTVIEWLKANGFEGYKIKEIPLTDLDAKTKEEQERRNRFYMRHGFSVRGAHGEEGLQVKIGLVCAESVADLTSRLREGTQIFEWKELNSYLIKKEEKAQTAANYREKVTQWYMGLGHISKWIVDKMRLPLP